MSSCIPDWRWLAICEAQGTKVRPTEEFTAQAYDVVVGHVRDPIIEKAIELFHHPYKRDALTAFLISKALPAQIEKGLIIKPEVAAAFEKLFVDPTQFEDKMDLHLFAQVYREKVCHLDSKMLIEKALTDGTYALMEYFAFGNETNYISDEAIAAKLIGIALSKAAIAAQSSLLSPESRESYRWAQLAVKVMDTRNKLNPTSADADELMIELQQEVVTDTIGEAFVGFDLSHLQN
jgi:hypothetical protein